MGDCRAPPRGCNWGVASIWARRSGEAPSRNHECPSSLIATWVWLRALPLKFPARREEQLRQGQFPCGKAPPAAEPRILTCMSNSLAHHGDTKAGRKQNLFFGGEKVKVIIV